jgi:LemA protein
MNLYLKIIAVAVGLVIIYLIWTFNRLVIRRNRVDESWSDIDVQLRRRYNLIPNLVEVVKAYAKHEKQIFEKIAQMRAQAMSAKTVTEHSRAENALTAALHGLFAVAENYPDLKASQNFLQLQNELSDTEDKIQAARNFYNSNVRDYNTTLHIFPNNLIAKSFGFTERQFFEIEKSEEKEMPETSF